MEMQMGGRQLPAVKVACTVCRSEVQMSAAITAEATDYVAHFCGLDCYQQWLAASRTPGDDTF